MRLGPCQRSACTAQAVAKRILRLGDRQWEIRLCRHHVAVLSMMVAGWVRDAEQQQPDLPRHVAPVGPPADIPAKVLDFTVPEPARKVAKPVPASPRARSRLRVVSEEGVQDHG